MTKIDQITRQMLLCDPDYRACNDSITEQEQIIHENKEWLEGCKYGILKGIELSRLLVCKEDTYYLDNLEESMHKEAKPGLSFKV